MQHCARMSVHARVEPAPRRRVAACRGSDSCPIKARLCVFSRPLPRRPALSPYFQPVCTPHPGLPAHLGGYALAPAGVVWNDLRREKREFCVSPQAVSVILLPWISSGSQETFLIWLQSSSYCSKYGKAGLVQVSRKRSRGLPGRIACVELISSRFDSWGVPVLLSPNQQASRCVSHMLTCRIHSLKMSIRRWWKRLPAPPVITHLQ